MYIGECDPLRPRLEQHSAKKDFWTQAIAFTSKDENLNKAHVQYLESRLVALAKEANRCTLDNQNAPAAPWLSEADQAEMERFLSEMLLIIPVIGVDAFETPVATKPAQQMFTLSGKGGAAATGYETNLGFVVLAGSEMRQQTVPSLQKFLLSRRQTLVEKGIVAKLNDSLRFTQDYLFDSPSTAAGVILGCSANGRVEWKNPAGQSLNELQTDQAGG